MIEQPIPELKELFGLPVILVDDLPHIGPDDIVLTDWRQWVRIKCSKEQPDDGRYSCRVADD